MPTDPEHTQPLIAPEIDALAGGWDRREIPGVINRIADARNQILLANSSIDSTLASLFLDIRRAG